MERRTPLGQCPLPAGKQDDIKKKSKYIIATRASMNTLVSTSTSSNLTLHTTGLGIGDEAFRWVASVFRLFGSD